FHSQFHIFSMFTCCAPGFHERCAPGGFPILSWSPRQPLLEQPPRVQRPQRADRVVAALACGVVPAWTFMRWNIGFAAVMFALMLCDDEQSLAGGAIPLKPSACVAPIRQ